MARQNPSNPSFVSLESLEERRLLSWGTIPHLLGQDAAAANYSSINGANQTIVIIDSGIMAHPALTGKNWVDPADTAGNGKDDDGDGLVDDTQGGWDWVHNDNVPDDVVGHGTQVAGIAAASPFFDTGGGRNADGSTHKGDGLEYQGVAPGARIIAMKITDSESADQPVWAARIHSALQWVERNYKRYNIVSINMSIYTPTAVYNSAYAADLQTLYNDGVFIAAAAGGQGSGIAPDQFYPGASPYAYRVGGTTAADQLTPDTMRDAGVDIYAPALGVPILMKNGTYASSGDGTSYSTPFVAGTAALLKQIDPRFTPAQMMQIMQDSATTISSGGKTYKRLNVYNAITLALQRKGGESPFSSVSIPTGKIEAENFDYGGEGVGYHENEITNYGQQARDEAVDIEATADSGGGYDVGWTKAGEWMKYTVNIAATGTYSLGVRVASGGNGGTFHVEVDSVNKTGAMTVPNTGGWQNWTTLTKTGIPLSAGTHVVRLVMDSVGSGTGFVGNFNYLQFAATGSPAPSTNFTGIDIGATHPAGSTVANSSTSYTLRGGGADIWNYADALQSAYKTVTGNFDYKVRVTSLTNTDPWAKAGLLIRDSLAAGARDFGVFTTPTNGFVYVDRATANSFTTGGVYGHAVAFPNAWVRITRSGNTFTAFVSSNGSSWTQVAQSTMALPTTIYFGLAATSHHDGTLTTATFDNVPTFASASAVTAAASTLAASSTDTSGTTTTKTYLRGGTGRHATTMTTVAAPVKRGRTGRHGTVTVTPVVTAPVTRGRTGRHANG